MTEGDAASTQTGRGPSPTEHDRGPADGNAYARTDGDTDARIGRRPVRRRHQLGHPGLYRFVVKLRDRPGGRHGYLHRQAEPRAGRGRRRRYIAVQRRHSYHPLLPHLRGTDIKAVVDSSGFQLGKALAGAPEEGVWVEYLWPHPVTLLETPKVSYAARHDGILFASGFYEAPANVSGRTKAYVRKAIDFYKENGREETAAFYGSQASFKGQWRLAMTDESDVLIVHPFLPQYIGGPIADLTTLDGQEIGKEIAAATEEGLWTTFVVPSPGASETVYGHTWSIRYDGLLFSSSYYDDRPEVPEGP